MKGFAEADMDCSWPLVEGQYVGRRYISQYSSMEDIKTAADGYPLSSINVCDGIGTSE
jgi:hypothetical protein